MNSKLSLKSVVILIVFVLVILIPLATIRWSGAEFSDKENRMLAPMPVFFDNTGELSTDIGSQTKKWLEDHIGLRNEFLKLQSKIKLNIFNQSPNKQVHIGSDGWYYYTLDNNMDIATGSYPLSESVLDAILQQHIAIQEKLAKRGIEYVVILPTSKVSIYPEYMRYGDGRIQETPVDIVADYLEQNSNLKVVRLKEVLLDAKKTEQVYFKTDTHWTQSGAYVGYREIISKMREWGLCSTETENVSYVESTYLGEMGGLMGSTDLLGPEPTKNTVLLEQNAIKNPKTVQYSQLKNTLDEEKIYTDCYYYLNDSVSSSSVLMFGDSMFGSWNITELMAENFSKLTYVWDRDIRSSLLDVLEPDIVIYELTERYLNVFPRQCSTFLLKPLDDYQAEIVSYDFKDKNLEVTVRNTSHSVWKAAEQIKACIKMDGKDTGLRAELTDQETVGPGEEATLRFEGIYDNQFGGIVTIQMRQETITFFGEEKVILELSADSPSEPFSAGIATQTIPKKVDRAEQYTIRITVKNTGSEPWSERVQVRLGMLWDGKDKGDRIALPENVTVKPGETYTFIQNEFTVPPSATTYFQYTMLQEGVSYFGDKVRVDISVGG